MMQELVEKIALEQRNAPFRNTVTIIAPEGPYRDQLELDCRTSGLKIIGTVQVEDLQADRSVLENDLGTYAIARIERLTVAGAMTLPLLDAACARYATRLYICTRAELRPRIAAYFRQCTPEFSEMQTRWERMFKLGQMRAEWRAEEAA